MDFFLEHITAEAVKYFGYATAEECRAAAEDCVGDPTPVDSMSETTSQAITLRPRHRRRTVIFAECSSAKATSGSSTVTRSRAEIPSGVTTVAVSAVDYGFDWDKASYWRRATSRSP